MTVVLLSGAVPLGSQVDGTTANRFNAPRLTALVAPTSGISPYASAVVVVSIFHHASSGFYCYGRYTWTHETGYLLGCIGSCVFFTMGLYCAMFAGDKAMISKYHHFDQSTSGFPFENAESYRSKKKAL